jgi:hypothetical protein
MSYGDPWTPTAVPASDTLAATGTDASSLNQAQVEHLAPDAILVQTAQAGAVTDIDDDPDRAVVTLITEGSSTTDASSYTTASVTPAANVLHLLAVSTGNTTGAITAPTVTGNGLTWTAIGDIQSTNHRTTLFRASGVSPSTGAITIDYAGVVQGNCSWRLMAVPYANTTTPVVQSNTGTGTGSTTASLALPGAVTAGNLVVAAYNQNTSTVAVGAGTGFKLIGDQTLTNPQSPSTRLTTEWAAPPLTPATFVVGSGASWGMVVAEIAIVADPDWLTGTSATAAELRVSFPTPANTLKTGFTQEFRIRVRPRP